MTLLHKQVPDWHGNQHCDEVKYMSLLIIELIWVSYRWNDQSAFKLVIYPAFTSTWCPFSLLGSIRKVSHIFYFRNFPLNTQCKEQGNFKAEVILSLWQGQLFFKIPGKSQHWSKTNDKNCFLASMGLSMECSIKICLVNKATESYSRMYSQ